MMHFTGCIRERQKCMVVEAVQADKVTYKEAWKGEKEQSRK